MNLVVRDVVPADAQALVNILNPIIASGKYTVLDTEFTAAQEREFIEAFPAKGVFHAAVSEGDVVGFQVMSPIATYTAAFAHVADLGTYVDLNRRRQGIASALFRATFAAAKRKGYEKIFTFVRADNPVALQTYRKHGFSEIGRARRHAKINGAYVDEILIEAFL